MKRAVASGLGVLLFAASAAAQLGIEAETRPSQDVLESVKRLRERLEEELVPALKAPAPARRGSEIATEVHTPLAEVTRKPSRKWPRAGGPASASPFLDDCDWEPQAGSP